MLKKPSQKGGEMLRVPKLRIPENLPHPDAISSSRDNPHSYEPEFWELQYLVHRYLERVPDELLIDRYNNILRNMYAWISRDGDVIPIQSYFSSWYWFRKEHQTRFEFAMRGLPLPTALSHDTLFNNEALGAPVRPKFPNGSKVLFRYDKHIYIERIAYQGQIRIRPASDFRDSVHRGSRQDDECSKKSFIPGANVRITTQDGRNLPIIGDVQKTVISPDYYVFCMSGAWDSNLFAEFDNADACLLIKNTDLFASRIEDAAAPQLPGWYFHHNPVQYFDPYEMSKNEFFDANMSKDFKFAYQREYRFLWFPMNGGIPDGFKFLELGSLDGLAEVHPK